MNESLAGHSALEKAIALHFQELGEDVLVEPRIPELLSLGSRYRPDILINTRDGRHVILEVKQSVDKTPLDRYFDIANKISELPKWDFFIVDKEILNDKDGYLLLSKEEKLERIKSEAQKAEELRALASKSSEPAFHIPAFLVAFSSLEKAASLFSQVSKIPLAGLPLFKISDYLYSEGLIEYEIFKIISAIVSRRNELVHSVSMPTGSIDIDPIVSIRNHILSLIQREASSEPNEL